MNVIRKPGRGLHPMFEDQSWFALFTGAGTFVGMLMITFAFNLFTDVSISGWDIVASIAPWFVAFMSGWVLHNLIQISVANGETRRHAFEVWLMTLSSIAIILATVITVGYPLERLWYRIMDFPGRPEARLVFADPDRLYTVFAQYLLVFAIWGLVGGMVGAAVYRESGNGWWMLWPASMMLTVSGVFGDGGGFMGFLGRVFSDARLDSPGLSTAVGFAMAALALLLGWVFVRTTPLRNK